MQCQSLSIIMLYKSDFAYFLRDPAPEVIKRSYLSRNAQKSTNNIPEQQKTSNDNKFVVINVNDCLKNAEKNVSYLQPAKNDKKTVKRVAVKWATKTAEKRSLMKLFERYCENSTVHGLRFFVQRDQHWSER